MKVSHFLSLLFIILCSCGQQRESGLAHYSYNQEVDNLTTENENKPQNAKRSLKAYKIKAQRHNMLFGIMPIPNSWKKKEKNKENILFESPEGVKVYGEFFKTYYYSNNPQQNYFSQQNGSEIYPVKPIERLINEDLKPLIEAQGLTFLGQFQLPQLAQSDQRFDNALFKATPEQKKYQCIVTEWENKDGVKSLGILRYFTAVYTSLGGMDWGYTLNTMEAPTAVYEQAKKDYINALINFQYNPNWIQANNQYFAQQSQQSNVAHQQRMAAIKAQGQAIINNGNTNSSIIDSNHESWKRRTAMTDAGHAKAVDGIWDRSNMYDQSGNQYQVEGSPENVWVNNNDQYITTNNVNWNPNVDQVTYFTEWEPLSYTNDN